MCRTTISWIILATALVLSPGCGTTSVPADDQQAAKEKQPPSKPREKDIYRLDAPIDISLKDWLAKPRSELAKMADELGEKIQLQEKNHRENNKPYALLPDLSLPLAVPVFREAKYCPGQKMSLPPYLAEGKKDSEIALHLARFGDFEAARKVAPENNRQVKEGKKAVLKRNYPLEWTRLVALQLHAAQIGVAAGEKDSARQLVGLHEQLRKILEGSARGSLLGATLLGRGRTVLAQAASAWRAVKNPELADQAEAVLARWGEVPASPLPVRIGDDRRQVATLFGGTGPDLALQAPNTLRALDMLCLPIPEEEVEAVIATFNRTNRLAEINVIYRCHLGNYFPQPGQLGHLLEDQYGAGKESESVGALRQKSYRVGKAVCEVLAFLNHSAVSSAVRLGPPGNLAHHAVLPRDFQVIHLDRSFEENRLRFALNQGGRKITVEEAGLTAAAANLVPALRPTEATLEGDAQYDLVARFSVAYLADRRGLPGLAEIGFPLWKRLGPGRLKNDDDKDTPHLALVWDDGRTHIALRLPHEKGVACRLDILDRTPPADLARRAARVAENDRAERAKRFQEKKLLTRIPRVRESVALGKSQTEVESALPSGKGILRRQLSDGLSLFFQTEPEESPGCIPRELFVRWGPDRRAAEVRIRYTDAPGTARHAGIKKLLAALQRKCGAPEVLPGPWAKVWTPPFPRRKPAPVLYRWQDDATRLTCQCDSEGAELCLRDCPLQYENGVALARFAYLPAGPEKCLVGMKKADLVKLWNVNDKDFQQGNLVLFPAQSSPYDQLLVTFNKAGDVAQVTARHRKQPADNAPPEHLADAVRQAWGADVRHLGWPRREDRTRKGQIQSWTSHDDVTRLSIFWQEDKAGAARVFTEWRLLE
jgi:hypothetical protein